MIHVVKVYMRWATDIHNVLRPEARNKIASRRRWTDGRADDTRQIQKESKMFAFAQEGKPPGQGTTWTYVVFVLYLFDMCKLGYVSIVFSSIC